MLAYPVEHIIYGDYVYQTWDPKMIEDLMGFFTPKNMRIDVVSKSIKSEGTLEIYYVIFGLHVYVLTIFLLNLPSFRVPN